MKKWSEVKKLRRLSRAGGLAELREVLGPGPVRSLQTSGTLHVWRMSSPHNWWVENARKQTLWHSHDGCPKPDLRLFEAVSHSDDAVPYYSFGTDCGKSQESVYRLRRQYR